jgi:hypothetical protein
MFWPGTPNASSPGLSPNALEQAAKPRGTVPCFVIPGLVPVIPTSEVPRLVPGTSPGMTRLESREDAFASPGKTRLEARE